ncbi:aldose 1-epimerase family protein [Sphingomonas sp. 3-13AW]|uniref:aldose 1-epimerase family protein n=1 Tax=Sphingomonas sp. 3-13AW TaxID=3050450 RepID=UPI003BB62FF5
MADRVEIGNGILTAAIDPLGAELVSLRDAQGRELMTNADPAYWTGHAPILFPIVGRLAGDRYRLDGRDYALPQHGFARRRTFTLAEQSAERVRFRLEDDAESRAVYPRAFALDVTHALEGATLTTTVTVTNRDTCDLPASIGFHHAFAWPLPYGRPRDAHRITFETPEPATLASIEDGLIAPAPRPSPLQGCVLPLSDDLFTEDALVWRQLKSQSLRYDAGEGPALQIGFPDTPMLGIWTKPGAAFICVEPWHGIADPVGFDGEIWDKPGMMRVAPGASRSAVMSVTLLP